MNLTIINEFGRTISQGQWEFWPIRGSKISINKKLYKVTKVTKDAIFVERVK